MHETLGCFVVEDQVVWEWVTLGVVSLGKGRVAALTSTVMALSPDVRSKLPTLLLWLPSVYLQF